MLDKGRHWTFVGQCRPPFSSPCVGGGKRRSYPAPPGWGSGRGSCGPVHTSREQGRGGLRSAVARLFP